jgi:hypothetical protein
LEKIILEDPVESKLWGARASQGMLTIKEDALLKAFDKKIPFSEVNQLSSLLLAGIPESPFPQRKEKQNK